MISVDEFGVVEIGFELVSDKGSKLLFHQRRRSSSLGQRRFPNHEIIHQLRKAFEAMMNDLEYTTQQHPDPEYQIKIDNFVPYEPLNKS